MKLFVFFVATVLFPTKLWANDTAEVMMFGTFHFSNPGLDKVKTKQHNVTTKASQDYLVAFSHRIATKFKPTHVLVECQIKHQQTMDEQFSQYLQGSFELPVNENYQLGFRIAKMAGVAGVSCYDNRDIEWNAQPLFDYMPEHAPETKVNFDKMIADFTQQMNKLHEELSLAELLAYFNNRETDRLNKSIYIMTNDVGAFQNYEGADAAASWWHRNFRMYANVQHLAKPGTRILVIGGQGHIAILKDFLETDPHRKSHNVNQYF